MKPQDLQFPFLWHARSVALQDHVWYVPSYYDRYEEFVFPGWEHTTFFGNRNPVHVEYCSGNGAWIAAKAAANRNINWVAVEKKFERVRKIWSKIKKLQLTNLIIVCGEGHLVSQKYFPANSVQEIYINFPDPWPKNRHTKHRLIQPAFIHEMHRILVHNASLTMVTDDEAYSKWMIEMMRSNSNFISHFSEPFFHSELEHYGTSYFEQLWREKGKTIRYHKFIKHA